MIRKLFRIIIAVVFIAAVIVVAGGYGKYKQAVGQKPVKAAAREIMSSENYTELEDMSETFVNAMVAVEDKRFYKHGGFDIMGIGRAVKSNFETRNIAEGGSSITQQLAKNIYFMHDATFSRKVAEIMIAVELEKNFSKEEILELYFNVIYYGSGYYNIYDASVGYFGKKPSELTDYEATLLAGIPNAPSVYSLDNNPDLAKQRQKTVVKAMVNEEMITQAEADEILSHQ